MDHCPIIVHTPMQLEKINKPFQFFNFMTHLEGFKDAVDKAWSSTWYGDHMSILSKKIKEVKQALVALNKANGNVHSNVAQSRSTLHNIQNQLQLDPHNSALME